MSDNRERTDASGGFRELDASGDGFSLSSINPRLLITALIAVVLGLFIFQNTGDASVTFLFWDVTMPLFLLILLTIVLTLVAAVMIGWMVQRRNNKKD